MHPRSASSPTAVADSVRRDKLRKQLEHADRFEPGTRGSQALVREAEIFSLAIDHHHWAVNLAISLVFVLAHGLFIAGQVLDLWEATVSLTVNNVSIDCPGILNVSVPNVSLEHVLLSDSYATIVQGMWVQFDVRKLRPESNVDFNTQSNARIFSVLLLLFSGCWPHVKLVATHWLWYARHNAKQRTRALVALEFFGKWSMLDVLAIVMVCTVFAVDFSGELEQYVYNIMNGAQTFLDTMKNPGNFSHVLCHGLVPWPVDPPAGGVPSPSPAPSCYSTVEPFLDGSSGLSITELMQVVNFTCQAGGDDAFAGSVNMELGAYTRDGVYFFSTAVWISLLLSAFTNFRNEVILIRRHREVHAKSRVLTDGFISGEDYKRLMMGADQGGGDVEEEEEEDYDDGGDGAFGYSELRGGPASHGGGQELAWQPGSARSKRQWQSARKKKSCATLYGHAGMSAWWNVVVVAVVVAALACEYVMLFVPYLERQIVGSAGHLVNWLNNETDSEDRFYTMWENAVMILHGNGDNPFLQKDLVIFLMVGPTVCLAFALLCALLPLNAKTHYAFAKLSSLGFTFSGVEVLALACLLTSLLLPVQSSSIVQLFGDNWCLAAQHL